MAWISIKKLGKLKLKNLSTKRYFGNDNYFLEQVFSYTGDPFELTRTLDFFGKYNKNENTVNEFRLTYSSCGIELIKIIRIYSNKKSSLATREFRQQMNREQQDFFKKSHKLKNRENYRPLLHSNCSYIGELEQEGIFNPE